MPSLSVNKLKKITFAGVPDKLSRHAFDDCDLLHDIIVPAGTSKTFRKALHFIDGEEEKVDRMLQTRSKTRKTSKNRNRSKNNQKQSNRAVVLTPQALL